MEKINISGIKETLYYEKLKNGLEIYLLPNNKVKSFYMTFNTKFGSLYTQFKKEGESTYKKIPNGVAHFLEHLTFKMEDKDASDVFANLGSQSNAYTSFKVTCYEVFGYDKFKENLSYLIDYVQTPYYSAKLVQAEKGIIKEEVKMYEDNPDVLLSFALYRNLFNKDNHQYLVSGTINDVDSTTLKDIENAYNTFYHPSNMFVIITGNFNPEEALAIIEERENKKNFKEPFNIKIKEYKEDAKVVKEYEEIKTNVMIPKVNIGLKIPLTSFNKIDITPLKRNILIDIIINSNFGRSSEVKERLVSGNIITDGILMDKYITKDYLIIELAAETLYPERFISIMKESIKKISITKEELTRKKRVAISNFIGSSDDIELTNASIQADIINYGKFNNKLYDIYQSLEYDKAVSIAKKINSKNMSIVVLLPEKDN